MSKKAKLIVERVAIGCAIVLAGCVLAVVTSGCDTLASSPQTTVNKNVNTYIGAIHSKDLPIAATKGGGKGSEMNEGITNVTVEVKYKTDSRIKGRAEGQAEGAETTTDADADVTPTP